jgi:hypothetical protein
LFIGQTGAQQMSEENNEDINLDHLEFESLSPLEVDAANMHELFMALCKAGFTENQALKLVVLVMQNNQDESDVITFHLEGHPLDEDEDEDEDEE